MSRQCWVIVVSTTHALPDSSSASSSAGRDVAGAAPAQPDAAPSPEGTLRGRAAVAAVLAARYGSARASPSLMDQATAHMRGRFGAGWRERFDGSHSLSLVGGVVFCRVCARHCEWPQHLSALARRCVGAPRKGSVYVTRLARLAARRHPLTGAAFLRPEMVVLPRGRRSAPAGKSEH